MSAVEVSSLYFLILLKHCIIDLWIQSLLTYNQKKSIYTSLSAQVHYAQHGLGMMFVLLFFIPWPLAILFGVCDYFAHWHFITEYFEEVNAHSLALQELGSQWSFLCRFCGNL